MKRVIIGLCILALCGVSSGQSRDPKKVIEKATSLSLRGNFGFAGENARFGVPGFASAPGTTLSNGMFYYNSVAHKFYGYIGGVWTEMSSGGTVSYPIALGLGGTGVALANGTAGQIMRSSGAGAVTWSTATYPTSVGAYEILYGTSANIVGSLGIGTANYLLAVNATTNGYVWKNPADFEPVVSLTASRALVSTAGGALGVSATTATEIGYVSGLSGAVQGQIDGKEPALSKSNLTGTTPVNVSNSPQIMGVSASAITIDDADANGATKGAAAFATNDFDAAAGVISIDYTNGQAAATGVKGFLTGGDWDTFNSKSDFDPSSTFTVGATGCDYTTIQAAITAGSGGETILVFPGTYTETITFDIDSVSIIGMGHGQNIILTQADANIVDFATFTHNSISNMAIQLTAPTDGTKDAITISTGSASVRECALYLATASAIAGVDQPHIANVTGAGTLNIHRGKAIYRHTGATTNGMKTPFYCGAGATLNLYKISNIDIDNSGTATASGIFAHTTTGTIDMNFCTADVDDNDATFTVGFGYIAGTATTLEYSYNDIHVHAHDNNAYGIYVLSAEIRLMFNHIHVEEDGTGAAYGLVEAGSGTIDSQLDDIVALGGSSGNIVYVHSTADGDFGVSGTLSATRTMGVTPNDALGLRLQNTTNAAAGAQQWSPGLTMQANGWKTDATAASQPVEFMLDARSVQDAAAPTGYWGVYPSINNAAYSATPALSVLSSGNVGIGTISALGHLNIETSVTNAASGNSYGFRNIVTKTTSTGDRTISAFSNVVSAGTDGSCVGLWGVDIQINNESTGTVPNLYSTYNGILIGSASASTAAYGTKTYINNEGLTTNAYGNNIYVRNNSNNAVLTNAYGDYIYVQNSRGVLSNAFGVYIEDVQGDTLSYGIYQAGGDDNYFSGNTGFGTAFPEAALHILNSTAPQQIWTHTNGADSLTLGVDGDGDATLTPSGGDLSVAGNFAATTYETDVSAAELGYISTVSSNVQDQLDAKSAVQWNAGLTVNETYSGQTTSITVGETVVFGQALVKKDDGEYYLTDADAITTMPAMCVALEGKADGEACIALVLGWVCDTDWSWTVGDGMANLLYPDDTTSGSLVQQAGKPSDTGDQLAPCGHVESTTCIYFNPSYVVVEVN